LLASFFDPEEGGDMFLRNVGPLSTDSVLLATCFHGGLLLALFFDHEDGGDMSLRNIGSLSTDSVLLATCFHGGFLLGLFFDPEEGGDMFLRNVGCVISQKIVLFRSLDYCGQQVVRLLKDYEMVLLLGLTRMRRHYVSL
jgi:hypothetical protein